MQIWQGNTDIWRGYLWLRRVLGLQGLRLGPLDSLDEFGTGPVRYHPTTLGHISGQCLLFRCSTVNRLNCTNTVRLLDFPIGGIEEFGDVLIGHRVLKHYHGIALFVVLDCFLL